MIATLKLINPFLTKTSFTTIDSYATGNSFAATAENTAADSSMPFFNISNFSYSYIDIILELFIAYHPKRFHRWQFSTRCLGCWTCWSLVHYHTSIFYLWKGTIYRKSAIYGKDKLVDSLGFSYTVKQSTCNTACSICPICNKLATCNAPRIDVWCENSIHNSIQHNSESSTHFKPGRNELCSPVWHL